MVSLTHAYIIGTPNMENIPSLYSTFSIVYIQNWKYAYRMGYETGTKYFLIDSDGKLYAHIHGYVDKHEQICLLDIDSQLNSNNELKHSLSLLPKYSVVKVGEFEVLKISIHENRILKFKLSGIPRLFNLYFKDNQTQYLENIKL
jgi:hypothetical protein